MCFRPPTSMVTIECPECGRKNLDSTTFCVQCGAELPKVAPSDAPAPAAPAPAGAAAAPGAPATPGAPAPEAPKAE